MPHNLNAHTMNPWDIDLPTSRQQTRPTRIEPVTPQDIQTMKPLDPPRDQCRPVVPGYPSVPLPPYPVCPPGPEPEIPAFITKEEKYWYDHAVINVPTYDDLHKLENDDLYPGKLVKVDNVEGAAKFYEWDSTSRTWVEFVFASDIIPISDEEIYEICGVVP